ncbi:proteinaceous RNase P 1 [Perilla frutescens var. hirtella]|uniref:ribonuclease P n=1 Tax=Perilla frutescens var. hirtella TaxID=608512 RepID=A0AAD4NWL8_PERFH|nr:proteinaceous RNase P 1 [Perilla frutescens var. hirtella]
MASFPYTYHYSCKPLQLQQTQLHLSSFSHRKCSSSLASFQFHDSPPSKHPLITEANARVAARSETALSGDIADKHSTNAVDSGPNADFLSGFSSFSETTTRAARKSPETNHIDAGKSVERRVILKDRYSKEAGLNSKRRKDVSSGASPTRSKSKKFVRNSEKTRTLRVSNEGVRKFGGNVEQKEKRIKKSQDGQPGTTLRLGLDMCSKRGDVVSAIQLYDLARKEGIKIGQYHYAVLLYLCSSAAVGVVQPAKSGSRTRSLSSGDGESSDVGSESLSEIAEIVNKSYVVEHSGKFELDVGDGVRSSGLSDGEVDFRSSVNGGVDTSELSLDGFVQSMKKTADNSDSRIIGSDGEGIQVSKDLKRAALQKGFEIYNEMRLEEVPMNEATFTSIARLAMALGDGEMAFDIVKQMKEYGINPRLRSYGPALAIFCSNGDVENAFKVEKNMLENGVYPEEPELEALLRVSIEAGKGDRVYYILHKLRASVRQVSPSTADLIEKWFTSKVASRVGKRKWDQELIIQAMENGGGGWHGNGWLGKGKWTVSRTHVGSDGVCKCCGEKLVTIDLDPIETESFAKSVASIAAQREKNLNFEKFQKWLDYYGPFEAVVDAANVGLYSQRKFKPSKVNLVVNGIRQMLPSKKWPLIVLHNRRITGDKMDEPFNRSLIEKWKNADALYATPTGSNDDWYWLYAAIKCRCLIVTNDEMRDHLFQVLGNDFFPKWKERHQVHFSFTETGPVFRMPPPCSVVIQETEKGHWHVPIASEVENEDERIWLCCSRGNSSFIYQDSSDVPKEEAHISHQKKRETRYLVEHLLARKHKHDRSHQVQESGSNTETVALTSKLKNHASILPQLESAEQRGACMIDFQI